MADKPIIFSAPMVRALLDGRKTQTRRVLKPQPHEYAGHFWITDRHSGECRIDDWTQGRAGCLPYFPGDRLWVREAWRAMDRQDEFSGSQIATQCLDVGYKRPWSPIQYEVDGARDNWIAGPHGFGTKPGRYRHARFMPRWASRLTLTVTEVRVQRLQEISEADAVAEGLEAEPSHLGISTNYCFGATAYSRAKPAFCALWNSLHGPDAWDANPWVVALTFDVHRGNIDQATGDE